MFWIVSVALIIGIFVLARAMHVQTEKDVRKRMEHFEPTEEQVRSREYFREAHDRFKQSEDFPTTEDDDDWWKVEIPENRPAGKWVNWPYRSGWLKVKGTTVYADEISEFDDWLCCYDPASDTFQIELERDPENTADPDAIMVIANCIRRDQPSEFMLGFIPSHAAAWLVVNYLPEIPLAAELKRFQTDGTAASIKIAALMPPASQRREFEIP